MRQFDDDDGRIVADMSEVERTPLLVPRLGNPGSSSKRRDMAEPEENDASKAYSQQPVSLDSEERRALIGGAVSAGLLVVGVLAAAFAGLIFLILHVWG